MSNQTDKAPSFILGTAVMLAFTWTVRVPIPGNDSYSHAELPLTFRPVEQPELDKMRGLNLGEGEAPPTDEQIVRRVVMGWPSLKDAEGEEVPFSDEALSQLLRSPMVRTAIVATYMAAMSGMAARKNG